MIETTRNRLQFKRFNADVGTSIPDDAKADMKNFQFSPPPSLSSFVNGKASFSDSKLPPPPPPPPLNGPPPPPPPGGLRLDKPVLVKKDVPPSSVPLKCFNWTKIPDTKVAGTIWNELDEAKLYKVIDLGEFDQLFSAYQKNGLNHVSSSHPLHFYYALIRLLSDILRDDNDKINCIIPWLSDGFILI